MRLACRWPVGALISTVLPEGPAARAGLQPGDLVMSFDSKPEPNARALRRQIAMTPASSTVPVGIVRNGDQMTLPVTLTLSPENSKFLNVIADPDHVAFPTPTPVDLGLQLAPVDPATRRQYKLKPDVTGLVVTRVVDGSTAALHGLKPGDVVLKLQDAPTATMAEFRAGIDQVRKRGRNFALVMVQTGASSRWVPLHVESF